VKVFSNAGPLMALGKLGHLDLLYRLFGQVGFSTSVYQEVVIRGSQRGYPDALLIEMALQREHLVVLDVIADDLPSDITSLPLDAGEKETIYLATRVPNSLVLLDDLKAREEAKARKLAVKGTVGVLVQAYRISLVTLGEIGTIFEAIIANDDIWIASSLCREVLSQLKFEYSNRKD
jgi:predicted nucleic acid-binding protein